MSIVCHIAGLGVSVPDNTLSNFDLEKIMDTSDEWIVTRTGIRNRYVLKEDENISQYAAVAAEKALADAKVSASEITHLLVATCSPETLSPSVACIVAEKLGLSKYSGLQLISPNNSSLVCFDFNAACSGFIYGLELSRAFLALNPNAVILLVTAESLSRRMNYQDRTTSVLFGDAAGAVVIRSGGDHLFKILDVSLGADGDYKDLIRIGGGTDKKVQVGDRIGEDYFLTMQGREVFKHAVRGMAQESLKLLDKNSLTVEDIDLFIAHQANLRILEAVGDRLNIPQDKVFTNLEKYGNTSASSIVLAMAEAREQGLLRPGQKTLLTAFGAGLTWGSALLV